MEKIAKLVGFIIGVLICLAVIIVAFVLFWNLLAVLIGAGNASGLTLMTGIGILVGTIIYTIEYF